jgi:tetratricopeptide (TPR) repeat protein
MKILILLFSYLVLQNTIYSIETPEALFSKAESLKNEAFIEADTLKYLKAIELYKEYINRFPKGDTAIRSHFEIAAIYVNRLYGRENYKKAVKMCKQLIEKYPKDKAICDAYEYIYHIYDLYLYNYQDELKVLSKILECDSLSLREISHYQSILWYSYRKLMQIDKAIREVNKYLEICKKDSILKSRYEKRLRWLKALGDEWKFKESEHFRFFYTKDSPAERDIERIILLHEKAYKEICKILEVSVPVKIEYFLFRSQEEAEKWFWKGIVLNSSNRSLQVFALYSDSIKASVKHELTHCIAYMINHHSTRARLELLSEGLAETMVGTRRGQPIHTLAKSILKDEEITIRDLVDNRAFHQLGGNKTYPIAGSFVKYLLDEYGIERFKFVYKYTHPAHIYLQLNRIFKKAYGKKLDELEKEWKEFLKGE